MRIRPWLMAPASFPLVGPAGTGGRVSAHRSTVSDGLGETVADDGVGDTEVSAGERVAPDEDASEHPTMARTAAATNTSGRVTTDRRTAVIGVPFYDTSAPSIEFDV